MTLPCPQRVRRRRWVDPTGFLLAHLRRAVLAVFLPWIGALGSTMLLNPLVLLGLGAALLQGEVRSAAAFAGHTFQTLLRSEGAIWLAVTAVGLVWPYSLVTAPLSRLAHPLAGALLGPPLAAGWCGSMQPAILFLGLYFGVATGVLLALLPNPHPRRT